MPLQERSQEFVKGEKPSAPRHHWLARSARKFWPKILPDRWKRHFPGLCIAYKRDNTIHIVRIKDYKYQKYAQGVGWAAAPYLSSLVFVPAKWAKWRLLPLNMIYRFSETAICWVVNLWKAKQVLIDGSKVWLFAVLGEWCKGSSCQSPWEKFCFWKRAGMKMVLQLKYLEV